MMSTSSVAVEPSMLGGLYFKVDLPFFGLASNVAPCPLVKLKEHSNVIDSSCNSKVPENVVSETDLATTWSIT